MSNERLISSPSHVFDAVSWLDEGQRGQLAVFRDLLLDWNQRVNLTGISEPEEVERRLFLEALLMAPAVDEARRREGGEAGRGTALTPQPATQRVPGPSEGEGENELVDVGTGAGFPGLVLKIVRPELGVTLVEATGKKVAFLHEVIRELGLEGIEAVHGRAEEVGQDPAYRGRFDVATARAVAALPALLELCIPLLRLGGRAFFPKSAEMGQELAEGERAAALVGGRIVSAELLAQEPGRAAPVTRMVIADKIADTPDRFPRRPGIPARDPLGRMPS